MNDEHRGYRELLGAHALGQLPPDQAAAVAEHVRSCDACRAELADVEPVADLLARLRARIDPDAVADGTVADGTVADGTAADGRGADVVGLPVASRAPADRRRRVGGLVAAAAVAVALVAGGYGAGAIDTGPATEPVAVQASAPAVRADAALIAHTWGTEITLDATGFDAGATYRVTVTDDRGRTVDAGEFIGTAGQRMRCNLNSSVLRSDLRSFRVTAADDSVVLVGSV